MATVRFVNDILSDEEKVFSVENDVSINSIINMHIDENVYLGTLVECYDFETGKTYFAPLEEDSETINAIILVNGKDASVDYKVEENDIVSIIITPASGESGSGWSWVGAIIGNITGSLEGALAGTAYGGLGWGTLIGAIIGGVLGFVAGGLVGGHLDTKAAKINEGSTAKSGEQSEKLPDVRGATNQPLLNQPYPVVFGKHLTTPFIVGSPYNDISGAYGEDNYIHVLYCVGYAPLRITDIKLGDQFLAHNQKWSGNSDLKNIWSGTLYGTDSNAGSGTDSGDITNVWKNNDISLEIIQQSENAETYYGNIYPYAKIQKDIDANVLYIASGTIQKIAQGANISYKGLGLKNGLRNNPIRLSEQFPKSLKVELDFPQGLYKSRSETQNGQSLVHYYNIPMWVAIQWRVYSDDNDKADGENPGVLQIPAYDYENHKYNLIDGKAKRGWNTFYAASEVNLNWKSGIPSSFMVYVDVGVFRDFGEPYSSLRVKKIYSSSSNEHSVIVTVTCYPLYQGHRKTGEKRFLVFMYPANSTTMDIDERATLFTTTKTTDYEITVEVTSTSSEIKPFTITKFIPKKDEGQWFTIGSKANYDSIISNFTEADRSIDIAAHTGNDFDSSARNQLNKNWINTPVFNFQQLSGTDNNKSGINEFRCVTEIDLIDWAEQNLRVAGDSDEEFVNKVKSYFFDSSNSTKSIEVRVIRISPNYIDETVSTEEHSAYKFNDNFTWRTLTSTMLDGNELLDNNKIIQKRPLPEEDMKKLCLIALSAKTDNVDQLSNTIRKFTCIAESFAPYYDDIQKKWFPENVKTKNGYYRYVEEEGQEKWISITEQQYYDDRQNGTTYTSKHIKSKCLPAGNDFVPQLINNVIVVPEHIDDLGRIYIPDDDDTIKYCNNNVASVFLYAGIGPHLGKDALGYSQSNYDENGLGDFNIPSLTKWFKFAECVKDGSTYPSNGYHFNHNGERILHNAGDLVEIYFTANSYIYSIELLENILANIAIAGRAVYTKDNKNRLCVIIDKPEKYPVALINQQNTLKSSYTITYSELPSGIQITYPDEDDGYNKNQLYCMTDGEDYKKPNGAIEPYSFKFVTNNYQAWSLGRYLLANRILNREVVVKQLGIEGSSIGLGDLVNLQDDTMLIGTDSGGRIVQLIEDDDYIYGFTINNSYHYTGEEEIVDGVEKCKQGVTVMQPGKFNEYRIITLRLANLGTERTVNDVLYKQIKGNTNLVLLEDIIAKSKNNQNEGDYYIYQPECGNIVGFGIIGKITSLYRVIKIKPSENSKYDFTLIKYTEDLFNYGKQLPSFQNTMTVPDRTEEDSYKLSENASQLDLQQAIASATDQAQGIVNSNFNKVPSVPSNLTVTVDRDKLHISCSVDASGIDNTDYILYEVKRHDNTVKEIKGNYIEDIFFSRNSDGYPEREELSQWRIRAKAVSVYTNEHQERVSSEWTEYTNISQDSLNLYGTWQIPNIRVDKEIIDRTVILTATYGGNRPVYGSIKTYVSISRVGNTDPVGDTEHPTFNELLGVNPDEVEESGEIVRVYYQPDFNSQVSPQEGHDNEPHYRTNETTPYESSANKISHTLPLIGQTSRIFKEGNELVRVNNQPLFTKDVNDYVTVPNSQYWVEGFVIHYTGEDDSTTVPQFTFYNNGYYMYTSSHWIQVYAKTLIVPTTYVYKIQMINEAGSSKASNEVEVSVEALPTNIADVVHSHEHYKNLYVEKLSAINANIGLITQGGMGSFSDMLNYWALSDLSAEDSGVLGGVKKGAFRVGGRTEYFQVTPTGNDNYKIELRAGNIELTSDVSGDSTMDFTNGTYVYNDKRTARLWLTPSGIVAQKFVATLVTPVGNENPAQKKWYIYVDGSYILTTDTTVDPQQNYYIGDWIQTSKVVADDKGNMILSNSDDIPPFGYQIENAVIYHLEDSVHPEYEEVGKNETSSNPQSLSFSGDVEDVRSYAPILETTSSSKCFNGTVSKDISSWTGRVVFFTKSDEVFVEDTKVIKVDGSVENVPAPLTGYNGAMRERSTPSSYTLGKYLGLNETQIEKGIFY